MLTSLPLALLRDLELYYVPAVGLTMACVVQPAASICDQPFNLSSPLVESYAACPGFVLRLYSEQVGDEAGRVGQSQLGTPAPALYKAHDGTPAPAPCKLHDALCTRACFTSPAALDAAPLSSPLLTHPAGSHGEVHPGPGLAQAAARGVRQRDGPRP